MVIRTHLPMTVGYFAMPVCVFLGLILGCLLTWRYYRRHERLGEATSQEILAELKTAFVPRKTVEIRTQTEYLPFLFECIIENVDSGFGAKQVKMLLERIQAHRPHDVRNAIFPIEVKGVSSDLDFQWSRDHQDRIQIFILADPKVTRALKRHSRTIPSAALGK
ncbi:MAG: hypothetical protein JWO82_38 [Akkermansiaceae bacterium]|nr:hypothetical protein [Akkermansiaceae bacterium]